MLSDRIRETVNTWLETEKDASSYGSIYNKFKYCLNGMIIAVGNPAVTKVFK